jgi:hypothetical protein
MIRNCLAIYFTLCILTSLSPAHAHPGHDHWEEDQVFHTDIERHTNSQDAGQWIAIVGATAVATGLCLRILLLARRSPRANNVGVTVMVVVFSLGVAFGCSRAVDDKSQKVQAQPRHDVKQLQTLFEHFTKEGVAVRTDDDFLYIESNAFPAHKMMIGITAWQQQVPLPQPYTGKNAWRVPLRPVVAAKPISAKTQLYRGAIAVAVDGVPIFNALNNRGEDAFLAGELDEFGGHCGRGDDYHYHIAPVHLEKVVGRGNPIGYALDGFALYGLTDAEGKEPTGLDEFNGRYEKDGSYRYYSSKKYPYVNGGMRGEVSVRGDQIEPQPKDAPVRPAGEPLRGAKITEFIRDDPNKTYTIKYEVGGITRFVRYTIQKDNKYTFVYGDGKGGERTETFQRRERR